MKKPFKDLGRKIDRGLRIPRRNDEDLLQMATAELVELVYRRRGIVAWHTPNGGSRSASEGGRFKAMGVLPGVADWAFVFPPFGRCGFVELKATKGRQSESQKAFQRAVEKAGCHYAIVRDVLEFQRTVDRWVKLLSVR